MNTLRRVKEVFSTIDESEHTPYECKTCGARFAFQRQVCSKCGGYTLDRIEWSSYDR